MASAHPEPLAASGSRTACRAEVERTSSSAQLCGSSRARSEIASQSVMAGGDGAWVSWWLLPHDRGTFVGARFDRRSPIQARTGLLNASGATKHLKTIRPTVEAGTTALSSTPLLQSSNSRAPRSAPPALTSATSAPHACPRSVAALAAPRSSRSQAATSAPLHRARLGHAHPQDLLAEGAVDEVAALGRHLLVHLEARPLELELALLVQQ